MRPLRLSVRSRASTVLGVEIGDLPVVVDSGVVEALLELGVDARQALQIVGLAARCVDAFEDALVLRRQLFRGRRLEAPISAPPPAWPRPMPSIAARATRSQ
jgi:hypothetical protein